MRKLLIAMMALTAAGATTLATTAAAAAYDYRWCVQGKGIGIPGDCSDRTYAQCMASASGRYATCNVNSRVAFARVSRQQPLSGILGDRNGIARKPREFRGRLLTPLRLRLY